MKFKQICSATLITGLCLMLVSGCSAQQTATIKIGGNFELTGEIAAFGINGENGAKLAIKEANEKGGVLKRQIEYISTDNQSNAAESTAATTKLVTQDKVIAIIGPMTNADTLAAIPVVSANNVLLITPTSTDESITVGDAGLNKWVFRSCFINAFQGKIAASYALNTLNASKAALIIDQNGTFAKSLAAGFQDTFEKAGKQIIASEEYTSGQDTDFRVMLAEIKTQNPDVIFIPGWANQAGVIIKQAREMEFDTVFLGGDGWGTGPITDIAGKAALSNAYYVDQVALDDPALADFAAAYKKEYGQDADMFAALGYDAANMIITAIEQADSMDTEKIREALENLTDFRGITGTITVDPVTHNPEKSAAILKFVEGQKVFAARVDLQ
ncbi:ethanolamine utilization protein EutJ [Dehalobacter sp. MCB1]|uniref:ABC transporter substrate-binding protein n=1 Tax=unclassified Dehalobacter TaxID=2635733 RepID=UPI000E6BA585|nr:MULTISPECIES: ABC transporter substrate-binding protein [unclassified Dehalobacter]RJE47560.1 ethanolamine utilization protein EutJ [Dehalobacter sp. MCB1]TCX56322.1 ethanolamine utilization protein EutJ [Dehalobacter sp. 12DCB1]